MPGANYMGGRRNAMKARVKDTVKRQQNVFFGNKRLDILSQGLSASKLFGKPQLPSLSLSSNGGQPYIDLAHARQKIPLEKDADVRAYVPKAVHIPRTTQDSLNYFEKDTHTLSTGPRKSRVLDAIDAGDPHCLRKSLDHILAMPDLACLSNRHDYDISGKNGAKGEIHVAGKRKRLEEDFDPRSKITIKKLKHKRYPGTRWPISITSTFRRDEANLDNDTYPPTSCFKYKIGKSIGEGSPDSYHRRQTSSAEDSDGEGISNVWDTRSWKSPKYHLLSSPTLEKSDRTSSPYLISPSHWNTPSPYKQVPASWTEETNDESDNFDQDTRLPSCIQLRPRQVASVNGINDILEIETSAFGSLFEKQDPWSTIGYILDLVNIEPQQQEGTPPMEDCVSPSGWQYSFLGIDGFFDNIYEPEEGKSDDLLIDDDWQTDKLVPYSSSTSSSVHLTTEPDDSLLGMLPGEQNKDMELRKLDQEQVFPNIVKSVDSGPHLHHELRAKEGTISVMLLDEAHTMQLPADEDMKPLGAPLDPMRSIQLLETKPKDAEMAMSDSIKTGSLGEKDFETGDIPKDASAVESFIQQSKNTDTSEKARILTSPILKVVNGRFWGPALLSKFDDSDEEL